MPYYAPTLRTKMKLDASIVAMKGWTPKLGARRSFEKRRLSNLMRLSLGEESIVLSCHPSWLPEEDLHSYLDSVESRFVSSVVSSIAGVSIPVLGVAYCLAPGDER